VGVNSIPLDLGLSQPLNFQDIYFDSTCLKAPIQRIVRDQKLAITSVWGDCGLHSAANEELLKAHHIHSGLCPRNVAELAARLDNEPSMREGLKRRAGIEARVNIHIRDFMGKPGRAKGIAHRELMVGWAVLSHNLWVLARLDRVTLAPDPGRNLLEAA
jgi:hypothetical protein